MIVRRRKGASQVIASYDAFLKTQAEYLESSKSGVTFSFISYCLIICLVIWETAYYMDTRFTYRFKPDTNMNQIVTLHIDLTVASLCKDLKLSEVDSHNISLTDSWFQLDIEQERYFQRKSELSALLREKYSSIQDILFRKVEDKLILSGMPKRIRNVDAKKDACRVHGSLNLNKAKGKIAISTASNSIDLPLVLLPGIVMVLSLKGATQTMANFSHRIDKFYFENEEHSIHPLEGDEWIYSSGSVMFKYFVSVVPTILETMKYDGSRFQYSVSQLNKDVFGDQKSSNNGGILLAFDFSPLAFHVEESRGESFTQFLGRLFGIVGGIFACSGLIHQLVDVLLLTFFRIYNCKLNGGEKKSIENLQQQKPINKAFPTSQLLCTLIDSNDKQSLLENISHSSSAETILPLPPSTPISKEPLPLISTSQKINEEQFNNVS